MKHQFNTRSQYNFVNVNCTSLSKDTVLTKLLGVAIDTKAPYKKDEKEKFKRLFTVPNVGCSLLSSTRRRNTLTCELKM